MEKPSLSEVKEYFKNAKTAEDWTGTKSIVTFDRLQITIEGDVVQDAFGSNWMVLYHYKKGYAKILTYKNTEPKFEITKDQISIINARISEAGKKELKEWFPEAFKKELSKYHTGWIKTKSTGDEKYLGYSDKGVIEYGISSNEEWFSGNDGTISSDDYEATTEEVTEALKNEAVKRGIKLGAYIVRDFDDDLKNVVINEESYPTDHAWFYHPEDDYLEHYGFVVYSKGQWANVFETKTIQEAEELLKELGHNFKIV